MSKTLRQPFQPPSQLLSLFENIRVLHELSILPLFRSQLNSLEGGDGHTVIVFPGFGANDRSTAILRRFLAKKGYSVVGWQQGTNKGAREELYHAAVELLYQLAEESGGKVSLIGQSLGGFYARSIAKRHPDKVRLVISLGTPFSDIQGVSANKLVKAVYKMLNPDQFSQGKPKEHVMLEGVEWDGTIAPPMPTTSIYSKSDTTSDWRACLQYDGHDRVENVEVTGSHSGMAFNAQVMTIIADRLAQSETDWSPFKKPKGSPFSKPYLCSSIASRGLVSRSQAN